MPSSDVLLATLLAADSAEIGTILAAHAALLADSEQANAVASGLKAAIDERLRESMEAGLSALVALTQFADHTNNLAHSALALRAGGNVEMFGRNNYEAALARYHQAADIYLGLNDPLAWANSMIGAVAAYGYLSQLDQAEHLAHRIEQILRQHSEWHTLFKLYTNLSVHYSRRGLMTHALGYLEKAEALANRHALDQFLRSIIVLNRSSVLRNLGRLDDAVHEAEMAEQQFADAGQTVYVAHAQTSRAITFISQGRYNEALDLFDLAREMYIASQSPVDAIWLDLFATNCWLQLGRYQDVLQLAEVARSQFTSLNLGPEIATSIVSEAVAYAALNRFDDAHTSFAEAAALFEADDNPGLLAQCRLEQSAVFLSQGKLVEATAMAELCLANFTTLNQPLEAAHAQLLIAQATSESGDGAAVLQQLDGVERVAEQQHALWLSFQVHALRGQILRDSAETTQALSHFIMAIKTLERLRGRLMTEFRADFLQDKESVYGAAIALCLDLGKPQQALDFAERARSRALVDLIAYRLDLSIQPRAKRDRILVDELQTLQLQRNSLYRRWMNGELEQLDDTRSSLQMVESQLTQLWHQLLVRNADYARDAALASVRSEPIQPYLDAQTLMLNFFTHEDELIVWLISAETITSVRLPNCIRRIGKLMRQLNLNLRAVSTATPDRVLKQIPNAQRLLRQLHALLIAPLWPELTSFDKLLIVPHGAALHYLPFHALFDGTHYLCESHAVSYLPSASLLHYQHAKKTGGDTGQDSAEVDAHIAYTIGYSNNNLLPFASEEAKRVAKQINGIALTESSATIANVCNAGRHANILHLSTHGDFNQDNPLFSGLALADGQLSTLDIFNLQLNTSLVTLSACQTGRSVVKGGDEIQGLARAFLYAGTDSLLVSLWQVHDRSTLSWMDRFYNNFVEQGKSKTESIQLTQRDFIQARNLPDHLAHPWFWAPFFLIGDTGKMVP